MVDIRFPTAQASCRVDAATMGSNAPTDLVIDSSAHGVSLRGAAGKPSTVIITSDGVMSYRNGTPPTQLDAEELRHFGGVMRACAKGIKGAQKTSLRTLGARLDAIAKNRAPISGDQPAVGRVTGIGGIFYKSKDPAAARAWFTEKLGVPMTGHFWDFQWRERGSPEELGHTVWSPFPQDTSVLAPSQQSFMLNLRVDNLDAVLARLKAAGVSQIGEPEEDFTGRYARVLGPDDVKLELWQPINRRVPLP